MAEVVTAWFEVPNTWTRIWSREEKNTAKENLTTLTQMWSFKWNEFRDEVLSTTKLQYFLI